MRDRYQTRMLHILVLVLLVMTSVQAQRSSAVGGAETHYKKGIELLEKQQLEPAITELLAATRLKPRFADAYKALGVAQARKGYLKAAIIAFRKAIAIDPGNYEAQLGLASMLQQTGDVEGA